MKKDELIAKQKEYIRYLKRAIHSESIIANITAGVQDKYDADISELEKSIEQEPVTESVKVPSDEILCEFCPLEKKGFYSVPGGYVAGCEGSHCGTALENMREAQSQVKTIDLREEFHIEDIKNIFEGIDKEDYETNKGWWETSEGAKFGKKKLEELICYINQHKLNSKP